MRPKVKYGEIFFCRHKDYQAFKISHYLIANEQILELKSNGNDIS